MQKASTKALVQKLSDLGFRQYSKYFIDNEITGADIPYLTEEHLIEMGISLIGHRMLILKKLKEAYDGKDPEPVRIITAPQQQISEKPPTIPERNINKQQTIYQQNTMQRPPSRDNNESDGYSRPTRKETPKIARQQAPRNEQKSDASDNEYSRPTKRETPRIQRTAFETRQKSKEVFVADKKGSDSSSDSEQESYTKPMRVVQSKYINNSGSLKKNDNQMKSDSSDSAYKKPTKRETTSSSTTSKGIKLGEVNAGGSESNIRASNQITQKQKESISKTKSETKFDTSGPPTQDDSGKVVCQYCGRKFLPDAAKRHIPVCGRIRGAPSKK